MMASPNEPTSAKTKRRTKLIKAYLTQEEFDAVKGRSKTYGVSISDLTRRAVVGLRMAAPVSSENITRWREVGRISSNLNQSARALNSIAKRLESLDASEDAGIERVAPITGQELLEAASENARIVAEIYEMMRDIRSLLVDQWQGNVAAKKTRPVATEHEASDS